MTRHSSDQISRRHFTRWGFLGLLGAGGASRLEATPGPHDFRDLSETSASRIRGGQPERDPSTRESARGPAEALPAVERAAKVQEMIDLAQREGQDQIVVPDELLPYDPDAVDFEPGIRMTRASTPSGWYDITAYGAATGAEYGDQAPAIQAAHDAASDTGAVIYAPGDPRAYVIGSTVVLSKPVLVLGDWTAGEQTQNGATRFRKLRSLDSPAFVLNQISCGLQRLQVEGESGNGGDGILINRSQCSVANVSVFQMGRDGVRIGSDDGNRVNQWSLHRLMVLDNERHGLNVDDTGQGDGIVDANGGVALHVTAQANGGDGVRLGAARLNTLVGVTVEHNACAGVHLADGASLNSFHGGAWNEGNDPDLRIDEGASNNSFVYPDLRHTNVTDEGNDNHIFHPRAADGVRLDRSHLRIGDSLHLQGDDAEAFTALEVPPRTRSVRLAAGGTGSDGDIEIEEDTGYVRLARQGKRTMFGVKASEPANGLLEAGEATLWIDGSGDLAVKMKRPDGSVASGTFELS